MHPARPNATPIPCPACGDPVDPLRAPRVVLLADGFRYLCGDPCRERFFEQSEERHVTPTRPVAASEATVVSRLSDAPVQPVQPIVPPSPSPRTPIPWPALAAAAAGLLFGLIPDSTAGAAISALATIAAAVLTLIAERHRVAGPHSLAWVIAPVGVVLASAAAFAARLGDPDLWGASTGAALAAGVAVARTWMDDFALRRVDHALTRLQIAIPDFARIPISDPQNPLSIRLVKTPVADIRIGEPIMALEGDIVAVDGIIEAGEAWAILHPGARIPVRRSTGDPILAGARIVEGSVRVRTSRLGSDRALIRASTFPHSDPTGGPVMSRRLLRIGGAVIAVGSLCSFLLVDGFSSQISAVAAILVAFPMLAAERATESPIRVAAAAAGVRGIVFDSPATFELAGRVTTTALCTHGTVTEGNPEVVQVRMVGDADRDEILRIVAGAEKEDTPIANAIRKFCQSHGITPSPARRATLIPGRGMTALGPDGEAIVIGNRQLLLEEGVSIAIADADAKRIEARGHTALFVGIGGRVRATIGLNDRLRIGTRGAVQRLFDLQVEVVLLSGDHRSTVDAIARHLDITHVKADLLPHERGEEVHRLKESGSRVAVVGHATQDAAALQSADVAIALSAAGGPHGERGIALANDNISDAAAALWVARAARVQIRRALLTVALGGGLLFALAMVGWIPPALAALGGLAVDAYVLPASTRLLRRTDRRIPEHG